MFKKNVRYSFANGTPKKKLITPLFVLRFGESSNPRYAVVASKSVSKKAVHRNKAKRIFIVALKEILLKQPSKNDLVFFLRRPYTDYQKSAIIEELEETLTKINS